MGRPIPEDLANEEALSAVRTLLVPRLIEQVKSAYDDTIVVIKGPEVAIRYPDPALRSFIDLDLLVPDPERAYGALLREGFEDAPDPPWAFRRGAPDVDLFADQHHVRPLQSRELPLRLELHRRPSWPRWLMPPRAAQFFEAIVPARSAPAVFALDAAHHALVLAAHSWVHEPLARVRDLIDITVAASEAEPGRIEDIAERFGVRRLWETSVATAEAVLSGDRKTLPLRTWARNLPAVRERTVVESHLEGWISCFWTLPPKQAARLSASNVLWDLRPAAEEPWAAKLRRARRAMRNAGAPVSDHQDELGIEGRQFSPRGRWRTGGSRRTKKPPP